MSTEYDTGVGRLSEITGTHPEAAERLERSKKVRGDAFSVVNQAIIDFENTAHIIRQMKDSGKALERARVRFTAKLWEEFRENNYKEKVINMVQLAFEEDARRLGLNLGAPAEEIILRPRSEETKNS